MNTEFEHIIQGLLEMLETEWGQLRTCVNEYGEELHDVLAIEALDLRVRFVLVPLLCSCSYSSVDCSN